MMNLQDALNNSDYTTATLESNGWYTTVDGSLEDGHYIVTEGVQGMPPTNRKVVDELSGIAEANHPGWLSVGEDGEVEY